MRTIREPGNPIRVVHFQRRPVSYTYSVEGLFDVVRRGLPGDLAATAAVSRFASKGVWRRVWSMLAAAFRQGDVNHVTGDVTFLAICLRRARTVTTFLDCGIVEGPLSPLARRLVTWLWFRLPARRSARLTAISEFTRRRLVELVPEAAGRVEVIPVCVPSAHVAAPKPFHSARPLVLHVGTTPNKNLARHVAALAGLDVRFDVVGHLSRADRSLLAGSGLVWRNFAGLSLEGVVERYREADLLLFASTYEGFGMPVLEAQATGRPVVTSSLDPLSDVAGEAACLVDPFDVAAIRAGVQRVIGDRRYREQLVAAGFRNAARFAEETVVASYARLYREVAAANRR